MPSSQGPEDEQKEPYFLTGKARESTLDFKGAIEAFEKALEVNPHNASAHFELGLRYEKEGDYSAAIYHFERFLKQRPDSPHADTVKDRITRNKMELSKTTIYAPMTQTLQRDFDKLADEVKQLRAENEKLRTSQSNQTGQTAGAATRQSQTTVGTGRPPVTSTVDTGFAESPHPRTGGLSGRNDTGAVTAMRSYAVKAGDTPTSIAKKNGIKLDALMAANPTLDPKRMKVGQSLKIPAP
jgi:tetratricopeptide (TPR) repeat protein